MYKVLSYNYRTFLVWRKNNQLSRHTDGQQLPTTAAIVLPTSQKHSRDSKLELCGVLLNTVDIRPVISTLLQN